MEAASWSEMIKDIERSKRTLPWERPDSTVRIDPVPRIKQADMKLKEREVNPVLMQYRDAGREAKYAELKRSLQQERAKTARDASHNMHSLLAHSTVDAGASSRPFKEDHNGSKYHILSKLPITQHGSAPTLCSQDMMLTAIAATHNRIISKPTTHRRYNMLSNEFIEDHERQSRLERERLQQRLDEAFWRTHDYDPIRQVQYDPAEEQRYQERQKFLESVQGVKQKSKLPKSVVKSEGSEYNIINLERRIEGELSAESLDQRSLRRVKTHGIEATVKARGDELRDREEDRRLRRISDRRRVSHLSMCLEPTDGRSSQMQRVSSWERLQTSPSASTSIRGLDELSSLSLSVASDLKPSTAVRRAPSLDLSSVEFGESVSQREPDAITNQLRAVRTGGGLRIS